MKKEKRQVVEKWVVVALGKSLNKFIEESDKYKTQLKHREKLS
jgi:hypothetical protein